MAAHSERSHRHELKHSKRSSRHNKKEENTKSSSARKSETSSKSRSSSKTSTTERVSNERKRRLDDYEHRKRGNLKDENLKTKDKNKILSPRSEKKHKKKRERSLPNSASTKLLDEKELKKIICISKKLTSFKLRPLAFSSTAVTNNPVNQNNSISDILRLIVTDFCIPSFDNITQESLEIESTNENCENISKIKTILNNTSNLPLTDKLVLNDELIAANLLLSNFELN